MNHHHHDHGVKTYNRSFAIGILLNSVFVVIEVVYGFAADSLALIADAGHNLSDVVSLILAWGASHLATKPATGNRTYGLRRVTILASLASALLLLVALGGIAWEAVGRLSLPQPVGGLTIIVVAAIGVVINTATALLFVSGQKNDLNIRGAYLHMAADAGVSLGVVVAGITIIFTGWLWVDPIISLLIVLVILIGTWHLLRDSINLSVDSVPQSVSLPDVRQYLTQLDDVECLHDLHIWALSTTETALTVHLVTTHVHADDAFLHRVQHHLHDHFAIAHTTIQLESGTTVNRCMLDRPDCI